MRTFLKSGRTVNVPPPYAVASGGGCLFGPGLFGVAHTDTAAGVANAFETEGVFTFPKAAVAVAVGVKLYWDDAARALTTDNTKGPYVAGATRAALAGDASVNARLTGVVI